MLLNLFLPLQDLGWEKTILVGPVHEDQPIYKPLREFGDVLVEAEVSKRAAATEGREPSKEELAAIGDLVAFVPAAADAPSPEDIEPAIWTMVCLTT